MAGYSGTECTIQKAVRSSPTSTPLVWPPWPPVGARPRSGVSSLKAATSRWSVGAPYACSMVRPIRLAGSSMLRSDSSQSEAGGVSAVT